MPESSIIADGDSLLIASPVAWRDACFSLPAVRALAASGASIELLCPDTQQQFWTAAGFEAVTPYPRGASARAITPLAGSASRALLWEAGPAADACAKAGIGERIGLPAPKLEKRLSRALERKIKPGPPVHEVQRFLDIAKLLGADPMQAEHFAPIDLPAERPRDTLLVVPESDFGAHYEWPLDRWAELVEQSKEEGRQPLIGALRNHDRATRLAEKCGCECLPLDLADPTTFAGHRNVLASDGSLPHLAAAFGTTCAVLFGPGDPALTRPLGKHHLIIRRKVECSPCFADKCPLDLRCQNDLEVARVIEKMKPLSPA